jgi:biotin carboxyl carrier protein
LKISFAALAKAGISTTVQMKNVFNSKFSILMDTPFKITVNESSSIELNTRQAKELDMVAMGSNRFHVLKDKKAYTAELIEADYRNKSFKMRINGNVFVVSIGDKYDQLVSKMGLSKVANVKMNEVKAPMPGLVLEVSVKVGDIVTKGDKVLILEAMKMENVLKAAGDGVVKSVLVAKGAAVEKGTVLIEME